jgi:chromosome segregation protein
MLDGTRNKAREDKDAAHRLAMQRQALSTRIEALAQSIERVGAQAEQLRERELTLEQQLTETREPIASAQEQLEAQLQSRITVEEELTDARQKVQAVEHGMREQERQRQQIQQQIDGVRTDLEQARLQAQAIDVRTANLLEQLQESGFGLQSVLESIDPEADEETWQQRLEKLGTQIQRLGAINLAAVDEYKSQSERKNYLDAQDADLVQALETLENAIRKIDRETRTRFKETFDKVNSGLQELFPKVFGGGHAYLELTGDDLLDTGVTIMARPPGKRNATIHLLSGGEKALTALSLVFSIFRLNPSPFCMLDEVDAPLDDANVGRFARMVREMSEKVQFIVITHNKITMEMSHHLMGVTMHEPGVSRMVSVDVDEAVALAESV